MYTTKPVFPLSRLSPSLALALSLQRQSPLSSLAYLPSLHFHLNRCQRARTQSNTAVLEPKTSFSLSFSLANKHTTLSSLPLSPSLSPMSSDSSPPPYFSADTHDSFINPMFASPPSSATGNRLALAISIFNIISSLSAPFSSKDTNILEIVEQSFSPEELVVLDGYLQRLKQCLALSSLPPLPPLLLHLLLRPPRSSSSRRNSSSLFFKPNPNPSPRQKRSPN